MSNALAHAERRVYEDFAKMRARLEKLPDGERKNKALLFFEVLKELCFGDSL